LNPSLRRSIGVRVGDYIALDDDGEDAEASAFFAVRPERSREATKSKGVRSVPRMVP